MTLENPRSARVRELARLHQKDARSETGLFLLEGPQAVREALQFRAELIFDLFVTDEASYKHPDIVDMAEAAGIVWETVSIPVVEALADTRTPQGVVAVCRQFPVSLRKIFGDVERPLLVTIVEEVRDPGNLGTIIRASDAAGADAVILSGRSVDLYNPKVVRSTTGSMFHIPIAVGAELSDAVSVCRQAGLWVVAADVSGTDVTEFSLAQRSKPTAWVFGNEARGLSEAALELVDDRVRLPIYGSAESLNVATAASVLLYHSAFVQRGLAGAPDHSGA